MCFTVCDWRGTMAELNIVGKYKGVCPACGQDRYEGTAHTCTPRPRVVLAEVDGFRLCAWLTKGEFGDWLIGALPPEEK